MTLHHVAALPTPSAIANALVELALPRLGKAWTYLADWDLLERARVPAPFRRELLDRDALGNHDLDTESLASIRDWERVGGQAPKIVVGQLGVGKSYAAARWVHGRARAGRSSLWVSVSTWSSLDYDHLRAEQRRALAASALVLDDLGFGASMHKHGADGKRTLSMIGEAVQALLLDRTNEGRKSLVLLNGEAEAIPALLGRRLIDRLKLLPKGRHPPIVVIKSVESLRKPMPEDDLDKAGRGRTYRRAMVLLDTFGAVNDSGVPFDFRWGSTSVLTSTPTFGGKLITRLTTSGDWIDEAERARKLIDADVEQLLERARLIQTDTETGWAAEAMTLLANIQAGLRRQRIADNDARAKKAAEVVRPAMRTRYRFDDDDVAWRHGPYGKMRVPELDKARLSALGFVVEKSQHGDTWALRREQPKLAGAKPKRRKRDETDRIVSTLSTGHPTDADAWDLANAIAFGKQPETQQSAA